MADDYTLSLSPNSLLTRKQAAAFLGVSPGTLAVWASTKRYPLPYVKVGRLIKYRWSDLLWFVEYRTKNKNERGVR